MITITGCGDIDTAIPSANNQAYAFFGKRIDVDGLTGTLDQIQQEIKGV